MAVISFGSYIGNLLNKVTSKVSFKNMKTILEKVLEQGSINLYAISDDKKEYKKLRRTITGENTTNDFHPEQINDVLRAEVRKKDEKADSVILIHDPSEIRKKYTETAENLGKVKDLNNKTINGYSSFNTIAIRSDKKQIDLVEHELYSNKQPEFLSKQVIEQLDSGETLELSAETQAAYDADNYLTSKRVALKHIESSSKALKKDNSKLQVTHVLDREFDDAQYFTFIDELSDEFVIRAKKSRTVSGLSGDKAEKGKLMNYDFEHSHTFLFQKLYLSGQCFQDCLIKAQWGKFGCYQVVLVTLFDRKGNAVFDEPMLLITNKQLHNQYDAYHVYDCYLKRSRIEGVFKFIKGELGWEEFRLKDFEGIKAIVAVGFFVASYLYEIGQGEVYDDFVVLVAQLGGAKSGQVTRHYIFEGMKALLAKCRVDQFIKENQVSEEDLKAMLDLIGRGGV